MQPLSSALHAACAGSRMSTPSDMCRRMLYLIAGRPDVYGCTDVCVYEKVWMRVYGDRCEQALLAMGRPSGTRNGHG